MSKVIDKISNYIDKLDDKLDDNDAIKIAKILDKFFLYLGKVSFIIPSPWPEIIKLIRMFLDMLKDDGDITKEDLQKLISNRDVLKSAIKGLRKDGESK